MLRRRQSGVALLIVLLVTALVTVVTVTLLVRQRGVVLRTQQITSAAQARAYALGAESYARELLAADFRDDAQPPRIDTTSDAWATAKVPFEVECGTLQLHVGDAQSGFNLNSVALVGNELGMTRLKHVLAALEIDPQLAERVRDWIDRDEDSAGIGGEDSDYLQRSPAYRAANGPFADESELTLLTELDPETRARLAGALVALPSPRGRVNVNTAGAFALVALAPNLSLAEAQAIVESDRAFADAAGFVSAHPQFGPAIDALGVTTDYFDVRVRVDCADVTVHLASLVHRDPTNGRTRVLRRNFGRIWFNRPAGAPVRAAEVAERR